MKKRVEIDTGKNNSGFLLEKKIKEYKEGIDYEADETGNFYTILSEKLKSAIWPDDYFWYDESVVVIDKQGKVESCRLATDNPREPYKKLDRNILKEIMNEVDSFDKRVSEQQKVIEKGKKKLDSFSLEKDTRETSNKNRNVVLWTVVISSLISVLLFYSLKKILICRRKSKKNYETKR